MTWLDELLLSHLTGARKCFLVPVYGMECLNVRRDTKKKAKEEAELIRFEDNRIMVESFLAWRK